MIKPIYTALIISILIHTGFIINIPKDNNSYIKSISSLHNISIEIYENSKGNITAENNNGSDEKNQKQENTTKENKITKKIEKNALKKEIKENNIKSEALSNAKGASLNNNKNDITKPSFASFIPKPHYPSVSKKRGEEGTVIINILLDSNGRPVKYSITQSSGYKRLDKEALKVIEKAKFQPAIDNGQKKESYIDLKINFSLYE